MTGTTPAFNSAATPGVEHRDLSLFMSAASSGDVAGMQAYIDKYGRENVDAIRGEPQAYTPLMWAAKAGNVVGIAFLLDHGADIHRRDKDGETPIIIAGWMGRNDAAVLLLQRGANLADRNGAGENPLDRARNNKHPDFEKAIRAYEMQKFEKTLHVLKEGLQHDVVPPQLAQFRPKPPR